ncbi:glycerol dehydratase [Romboutsia sp. CE17]|uniref:glycerol dehydratase reactivase beta/small subunit family protein n=1 Tax=Romboutsia sp. CE17 TaxID=2724150 RepID=UPI001442E0D6|nr:glycerol dehydratase reactivase beta/small subunit family protein [Romboutsia sp. CE17]QJA08808.1 glycerol dehydratase [Romboutsia sp. CE17]
MRMDTILNSKPVIKIFFDENKIKEADIKEVLWGIEEEGIPYEVLPVRIENAVDSGYKASIESSLGVGIGIDEKYIVLHYNKLKKDSPLFTISRNSDSTKIRSLGANAARLVIKMPFKGI